MSFTGRVKRKPRSDRNHVIYQVKNKQTGEFYIGITFVRKPTKSSSRSKMPLKSANDRFTSHVYRSYNGSKTLLHKNIKEHGADIFDVSVLEVVRGKKSAHQREIELIQKLRPDLNMTSRHRID